MNHPFGVAFSQKNSDVENNIQDVPDSAQASSPQLPARIRAEGRRLYINNLRKVSGSHLSGSVSACNETSPLRKAILPKLQLEEDERHQQHKAGQEFLQSQLQKPLEERLLEAGILSPAQLALVRLDQQNQPELSTAEILQLRNWHSETVLNFFINLGTAVNEGFRSLSIGQRLKSIGLLTDAQLETALEYKRQANIRLGHAIFLSGVLNQATVDYFAQF